jgi:ATP-dependent helicase YprA (DUF1998 family)
MPEHLSPVLARKRLRDILRRYQRNETLVAIGAVWGISKERVRQLLDQSPESAGKDGRPRKQGVDRWSSGKIKYQN